MFEKLQKNIEENEKVILYNKKDIMEIFHCESDKALRILKIMYQTKCANKIGREYYVTKESFLEFLEYFKGKNLMI